MVSAIKIIINKTYKGCINDGLYNKDVECKSKYQIKFKIQFEWIF